MSDAVSVSYRAAVDRLQAATATRDRRTARAALEVMRRDVEALEAALARPLASPDEATAWLLNLGVEPP